MLIYNVVLISAVEQGNHLYIYIYAYITCYILFNYGLSQNTEHTVHCTTQ